MVSCSQNIQSPLETLFEVKIEEIAPDYRYNSGLVSTILLGGIYNHTTT